MKKRTIAILVAIPLALGLLLAAATAVLLGTTTGAAWALKTAQQQLPGELDFDRLEGNLFSGLEVSGLRYNDESLGLEAPRLALLLSLRLAPVTLVIEQIELSAPLIRLHDSAENGGDVELPETMALPIVLDIRQFSAHRIRVHGPAGEQIAEVEEVSLSAKLRDVLELHSLNLTLPGSSLEAAGEVVLSQPYTLDLQLNAGIEAPNPASDPWSQLKIDNHVRGQASNYSVVSVGALHLPDGEYLDIEAQAAGTPGGMEVSAFKLSGELLELASEMSLQWESGLEGRLSTQINRLDLSHWFDAWPAGLPLSGELSARLSPENLRVNGFHLQTSAPGMRIDGQGEWPFENEQLAAELSWTGIQWPPDSETYQLRSRAGQVELGGTVGSWTVRGEASLEGFGLPHGELRFGGAGDSQSARMRIDDSHVLGGGVNGEFEYDWLKTEWSADLAVRSLHTESLPGNIPGVVSGELTASGRNQPMRVELKLGEINGEVKGLPFAASGAVHFEPGDVRFDGLRLLSGDSSLLLDGDVFSADGLDFTARLVQLSSLVSGAGGSVDARGRLSLHADHPGLDLELAGQAIDWSGSRLADRIEVHTGRQKGKQSLQLSLQQGELDLHTFADGSLSIEGAGPGHIKWAGRLESVEILQRDRVMMQLLEPANSKLSVQSADIQEACFSVVTGGQACTSAQWTRDDAASAAISLQHMPLQLLQELLATGFNFSQVIDGDLHWRKASGGPPGASASLRLTPGEIRFAEDDEILITTGPGLVAFELERGRLSSGQFNLPLPDNGAIDLDFAIDDLALGLDSRMDGSLKVKLKDMDVFGALLPILEESDGRLDADLEMSGTLGRPMIDGRLSLEDGMIQHEASGLRLENIQLSGQKSGGYETSLSGSFSAVEGEGQLEASLDLAEPLSPGILLQVKGENLTLFNSPDLKLVASPDVEFSWRQGLIGLNGKILVPSALISPSEIRQVPLAESPDLVIVSDQESTESEPDSAVPIAIRGELEVELGNDVALDINVAKLDAGGSVNFLWQDELIPTANGAFSLAGEILAFGQLLEIAQGNIGFPNVPADNPHLNIRAEREIFGNSEVRRAGLFISGTLRRPVLEPYTDPMTNRDRAQTLLVTGSDFNMETGVGAVDIGTYIAPRIFVSYGIGVFEDENVISIRYDLGRGWGVKATSGKRQTGVDMSYTIER